MNSIIHITGSAIFTFSQKDAKDAVPNENLGTLTVWLISQPKHPAHPANPLHTHTPKYAVIGRGVDGGEEQHGVKRTFDNDMTIEDVCYDATGVVVDGSFLDYVPCLGKLRPDIQFTAANPAYITRKIVIPHGRIRAGSIISWDWHGTLPARVAYMGTRYGGFATNEVIIEIGDDDDIDKDDKTCYLRITHGDAEDEQNRREEKFWPLVKGAATSDMIAPNRVELDISNLPARRRRQVFWGWHFQDLFRAANYPPLDYVNTPQYQSFEAAARAYDAYELRNDLMMSNPDQSFPFLIDPRADLLAGIEAAQTEYMVEGPIPTPASARQSGEGIPGSEVPAAERRGPRGGRAGGRHAGHDPHNTEVCPFVSK